jgi:precorrin-2/cobalt-factor-2 C20-methyltransferase
MKEESMKEQSGILYGIGVGPGDPELMTVKAIAVLRQADVVYTASSTKNRHSLAVQAAQTYLPANTPVKLLAFPMSRDRMVLSRAWEENARTIAEDLAGGKTAAFLTLGDCLTYSTWGYLARNIERIAPEIEMRAVPGITSYQAAAARINRPLVEGEESLLLVSGVEGGSRFKRMRGSSENVVFLKAYKNVADIAETLTECGYGKGSVGVVNCGLADERIISDITEFAAHDPNYWTLILARRNGNGSK